MARTKNTTEAPAEVTEEVTEEVNTISAKQLADELGVEPKAFRRWLRRHTTNRAGKGGRWAFSLEDAAELKAAYTKAAAEETADEASDAE